MKKVIIVRGIAGKGKTTIAEHLAVRGIAIAADDFPGLYKDGVYQQQLQKASHEDCKRRFREALAAGVTPIVLHNTFVRQYFIEPYKREAIAAGYSVQVIQAEEIWLPDGTTSRSTHNVPEDIIASMRQSWEPIQKKEEFVSVGSIAEMIDFILANPNHVPMVLADMDGTIKQTKTGKAIPESPDDAVLKTEFVSGMRSLLAIDNMIRIFVVSNQAGIELNLKSKEFLNEEIKYLDSLLSEEFQVPLVKFYQCAIGKGSKDIFRYTKTFDSVNAQGVLKGGLYIAEECAYKPSIGLRLGIGINNNLTKPSVIWMIGNSDCDAGFAKNLQEKYSNLKILYIPIELFPSVAQIHYQNVI